MGVLVSALTHSPGASLPWQEALGQHQAPSLPRGPCFCGNPSPGSRADGELLVSVKGKLWDR